MPSTTLTIRPAPPSDEPAWRALWRGYCDFYNTRLSEAVTDRTWARILDPDLKSVMCIVAKARVKSAASPTAWCTKTPGSPRPSATWKTVRRALGTRPGAQARPPWIPVAAQRHAGQRLARLCWVTHKDNVMARGLYDQFTLADDFVRYVVKP